MLPANIFALAKALSEKDPESGSTYEVQNGAVLFSTGPVVTRIGGVTNQPDGTFSLRDDAPSYGYNIASDFISLDHNEDLTQLRIHSNHIGTISKTLSVWRGVFGAKHSECSEYPVRLTFSSTRIDVEIFQYDGAIEDKADPVCWFYLAQDQEYGTPNGVLETNIRDLFDVFRVFDALAFGQVKISCHLYKERIIRPFFLSAKTSRHDISQGLMRERSGSERERLTPQGLTLPMFENSEMEDETRIGALKSIRSLFPGKVSVSTSVGEEQQSGSIA